MCDLEHGKLTKKQGNIVEKEEKVFYSFVATQTKGKSDALYFDLGASKHITNRSD